MLFGLPEKYLQEMSDEDFLLALEYNIWPERDALIKTDLEKIDLEKI